jgi:hypothetical protein
MLLVDAPVRIVDRGFQLLQEVVLLVGVHVVEAAGRLAEEFHQRSDGRLARQLAARPPAHAVRDDEEPSLRAAKVPECVGIRHAGLPHLGRLEELQDDEMILVHLASQADVGLSACVDSHR